MSESPLSLRYKRLKHKIGRVVLPDSPSSSATPFMEYIHWFRYTRFIPKFPVSIDIQTKSGCNAHCTVCPVGKEKAYWKKLGIDLHIRKLDNRANITIDDLGLNDREFQRVPFCVLPFWRVWILWNGDMVMCCVDQERSNILGNCTNRSIKEIWNDSAYKELRRRWRTKQLDGLLCENCMGT